MRPGSLSGKTPPPELTTEGLLGLATFLRQLHLDLPNALTTTIAASCLSDRVRLVGQLDEPIALGRGPYTILFGRLTQASKRMLEQGALKVKRDVPSVPASMEGGEMNATCGLLVETVAPLKYSNETYLDPKYDPDVEDFVDWVPKTPMFAVSLVGGGMYSCCVQLTHSA